MIEKLLNDIEKALGHYAQGVGIAPPYIKTDDNKIRDCVAGIRSIVDVASTANSEHYHRGFAEGQAVRSGEVAALRIELYFVKQQLETDRQLKKFYAARVKHLEKIISSYKTISMN